MMQCHFFKLSRIKTVQTIPAKNYSLIPQFIKLKTTDEDALLDPIVRNVKDKLLYSDYLERMQLKLGYSKNRGVKGKLEYKFQKERESWEAENRTMSIALKYLDDENLQQKLTQNLDEDQLLDEEKNQKEKPIHMPYATIDKYKKVQAKAFKHSEKSMTAINEKYKNLYEKYLQLSKYSTVNPNLNSLDGEDINNNLNMRLGDDCSNVPPTWMTDYEIYDDALQEDLEDVRYGTPDPNTEISSVPCGGCGALLHCKDVALPGYLPSELFVGKSDEDLKSIVCQRCHFMRNYNTCLDVRVSADDYPKLLEQIKCNPKALIILLVDLTDFPCSIWPGLPELIGTKRSVFVVGNKIDLLPRDSPIFLDQVRESLRESLIHTGMVSTNIKHIGLVSAKTGYGIEELINKLHKLWQYRSDVYLVGCTNAGKSTLFNTLLQSDLCKSQAVDLVQRATTSQWPGTTLNLLKFPILKHSSYRLFLRTQRLQASNKQCHAEEYLRKEEFSKSRKIELATLQSRITHTFKKNIELTRAINNSINGGELFIDRSQKIGLDETADEYKYSRWCFDTPGVIQPDQILHLLTADELMKTLPDRIISPRTFCLWSGQTIFIAGLGRLDILSGSSYIRCTVFASRHLPITICNVSDAEYIYNELLKSEAFTVPLNNPDRLKMWPKLKSKDLETEGIGKDQSVSDVVLSSAGWVAITALESHKINLRAWTPEGRGIYLRTPALLPKSVTLRGMRRVKSPAYRLGRQVYYVNKNTKLK